MFVELRTSETTIERQLKNNEVPKKDRIYISFFLSKVGTYLKKIQHLIIQNFSFNYFITNYQFINNS